MRIGEVGGDRAVRDERSEKVLRLSDARGGVESSLLSGEARGGVTTSQSSSSWEVDEDSRRKRDARGGRKE